VVALFRSLSGENLEDFSIRLAQAWRVGQKGLDNGVIFLIFLDDRKMRLEVGYGLEANLTDATAASIIRDVVAPRFRENRLADGIGAGLDAIGQAIAGTYQRPIVVPPLPSSPRVNFAPYVMFGALFFAIAVALVAAIAQNRGSRRRGWTGGRGGTSGRAN